MLDKNPAVNLMHIERVQTEFGVVENEVGASHP
jgi:hypothetical protein